MRPNYTPSGLRLPDEITEPGSWATAVLMGLQSKQVYQGTVPAHVVAARRRRNRAARTTRQRQHA
jgi:hypothetical protein